jgi:hypothetical protein
MPIDLPARLEEWKTRFGSDARELHELLAEAAGHKFTDAASLIRLHECLLFLRAYPADAEVMRGADEILFSFGRRMAAGDAAFEDAEVSGIAETSFSAVFSYEVARQLCARYARGIDIDWENYEQTDKLGPVLRRFLPLVNEDWPVEAHVPFRTWVDAARPRRMSALGWLLERIGALPINARERADLYESMELLLVWRIGNAAASRSRMRVPASSPFYHREPLLRRKDISLARELEGPPLPVKRVAKTAARKVLDLILDNSAMRYRELYGFTHPDEGRVFSADAGRGVEIIFFGVPPEWRLPLRAYHCGVFFKNGVPTGYVEVLSLFERAEVGFNLYYTFREGESAWLYARLLRLFRQVLGVTCFSVDPYQIGLENEEAIESGAFWFYRKLGFRPLDREATQLTEREEDRMRRAPGYRSSRRTLEKLARSYLLYESADAEPGAWDRFRVRNLALRCTAAHADDDALRRIASSCSTSEKASVEAIARAKCGAEEASYLRLMQRDARLRAAVIKLGSAAQSK